MNKNQRSLTLSILIAFFIVFIETISDSVTLLFAQNVIFPITIGDNPWGIAYNPGNEYMYVTNAASDDVSVIDGDNNTD